MASKITDQYAIIGPAIFVMSTMPDMAQYVRERRTGLRIEPEEVWIEIHQTWVRLDGERVSGWRGYEHFAFRPSWLNRLKIRMAAHRWRKLSSPKDTKHV